MRRQFLLSPYKDVIDDILAIVIIGDKDAVYDILVSQKPEGHPGAPAARDSIFGGPGRGPFPAVDCLENSESVDSSTIYTSNTEGGPLLKTF